MSPQRKAEEAHLPLWSTADAGLISSSLDARDTGPDVQNELHSPVSCCFVTDQHLLGPVFRRFSQRQIFCPAEKGYESLSFQDLAAFLVKLTRPGELAIGGLPAGLQRLQGRNISISGFAIPVKAESTEASEFLLMRHPTPCCVDGDLFVPDGIPARPIAFPNDIPLAVYGKFRVCPQGRETASLLQLGARSIERAIIDEAIGPVVQGRVGTEEYAVSI
jgi:hypothetical protein